MFIFVKYCI